MIPLPEIVSQAIVLFVITSSVIYYILKVSNQNRLGKDENPKPFNKRTALINSVIASFIFTLITVFISQKVDKQIKNNTNNKNV
jgi:hypothetical protein